MRHVIEEFRSDALAVFHDLPVFVFSFEHPEDLSPGDTPPDVEAWAWRVGVAEYGDATGEDIFPLFLETVDTQRVKALILGVWSGDVSGEEIDVFQRELLAVADRFPALEALFIADVPQNMAEISWIEPADPGPLLAAFPGLRVLGMRGRLDRIEPFTHARLEELVIQSGGLPPEVVRALGVSTLPALTRLDLYLGTQSYGGLAGADDLQAILGGDALPALRHLGLRDAENADEVAAGLAHAPVVAGLESLDLSLGTLSDVGAAALLSGQPLTHLKRLDLHHHFLSDAMIERLYEALPSVELDLSEQLELQAPYREGDEPYRYVALAE